MMLDVPACSKWYTASAAFMGADGSLVGPAVFKTVVRYAEYLGCVRFAHAPATCCVFQIVEHRSSSFVTFGTA